MRTKVLYLITKEDVGGAQKYVQDLADNLNKDKFEVRVVTGGKKGIFFLSNSFWPHLLFINDWLAIAELFFFFKKEKPDVVHLNSSKAGVVGAIAAKLSGVPKVVFTAHGWVFNPDNSLGYLKRKLFTLIHRMAARYQDVIINVSEYDRSLAIQNKIAPLNKLVTIYNGLDWENLKFFDKKTSRKALTTLAGLNLSTHQLTNSIWVGSIGRLVIEKSYRDFVDAAALVKNENVQFFIIGDGPLKDRLLSRIKKLGLENKFYIVNGVAPAAPYMKAFDIFLLSSIKEGLPYTLLEAMAAGLPVITTRVGGMTEIATDRGLVMQPNMPGELARAIEHLINNKEVAEQLAQKGNTFLKESLNLELMVAATEKIYLNS
ncbi:MAG: glycosyltransferase [bacterium]|nr:glycosyltransferase [bacterium]